MAEGWNRWSWVGPGQAEQRERLEQTQWLGHTLEMVRFYFALTLGCGLAQGLISSMIPTIKEDGLVQVKK